MTTTLPVLDYGFVKLRNLAGPTRRTSNPIDPLNPFSCGTERPFDADDTDIANAARMSFDGSDQDRTYDDEMRLTRYLMKNHHDTPFESIVVWLEFKLPIFVARQFVRHRTQSLNEVSGRYVNLPAEWYIPRVEDVLLQSADKKQGGKPVDMSDPQQVLKARGFLMRLDSDCQSSYHFYQQAIRDGIAMEQARCHLHTNHYTHWLSTMNLRNLLHFLVLRDHGHAQREARLFAVAVTRLLEPHIPGIMKLYRELMRGAA